MGEVYVVCVECGSHMEEHAWELKWDSYYISVIPCVTCMDIAREEGQDDSS